MDKASFAASQASLQQVDLETNSEIQEINVVGDCAYIRTYLSMVITPKAGGSSVRRAGNTLSILRKQEGSWIMVRDANMLAVVS
jgi:ketosteroid isomerase-like protein